MVAMVIPLPAQVLVELDVEARRLADISQAEYDRLGDAVPKVSNILDAARAELPVSEEFRKKCNDIVLRARRIGSGEDPFAVGMLFAQRASQYLFADEMEKVASSLGAMAESVDDCLEEQAFNSMMEAEAEVLPTAPEWVSDLPAEVLELSRSLTDQLDAMLGEMTMGERRGKTSKIAQMMSDLAEGLRAAEARGLTHLEDLDIVLTFSREKGENDADA